MNLKQKLSRKLKKNGGFTLIEMLIVVAIIAILVAVSIPMVNASLNKAKEATDAANERAAKAAAMIQHMTEEKTVADVYYYNADEGTAEALDTAPKPGDAGYNYGQGSASRDNKDGYITVNISAEGTVESITWTKKSGS